MLVFLATAHEGMKVRFLLEADLFLFTTAYGGVFTEAHGWPLGRGNNADRR